MRGPQPLPSRVIDTSADESHTTVKLRDTRGESGTYAALSYCWGHCSQRTTTKSTLQEHLRGIQVSTLPATIQDAIRLCRSLDIPYLWVDSLCIIQDDSDDWHHEAAEMAAIYGRSALTITTPENNRCDESFNEFQPTKSETECLPKLSWEHRQEEAVTGTVTVRPKALTSFTSSIGKTGSPWMTRGWTLQEWLLSPRVLHCGRERVWDCYEAWYRESCVTYTSSSGALNDTDNVRDGLAFHIFARMARLDPNIREGDLDTHWARLVEDFTSRALSREMDKMPAIAGLATEFMKHSHMKALRANYLAGLWHYLDIHPFGGQIYPTSQVPLGLLWRRSGHEHMRSPTTYRAPSWSWAALDGQVSLFRPQWLLFDRSGHGFKFKVVKRMEVNNAKCLFDPPGSCSMVQTGWIIATSPLKRAYINPSWKVTEFHPGFQEEYFRTLVGIGTHLNHEGIPWFGIFDQSPEQTGIRYVDDSLYLLHVATVIQDTGEHQPPGIIHHSILVEKVGSFNSMDCFRRLGVAWYTPSRTGGVIDWADRSGGEWSEWSDRQMLKDWESCKVRLI